MAEEQEVVNLPTGDVPDAWDVDWNSAEMVQSVADFVNEQTGQAQNKNF